MTTLTPTLIRLAALALASGLAAVLLYLALTLAAGWASRAAAGKGGFMALVAMAIALPPAYAFGRYAAHAGLSLQSVAIRAFLSAALSEEGGRLIALLLLARMMITRDPREYFVGIVAAGLGFGLVENMLYLQMAKEPLVMGGLRGALSAPAHLSYALLSGLGVWRFARERASLVVLGAAVGAAFLLHGLFDFAAMAWPSDDNRAAGDLSLAVLRAIGALMVIVVIAQSLAALTVIDAFLSRIQESEPHDPDAAHAEPLSKIWNAVGFGIMAIGGCVVVVLAVAEGLAPAQANLIAPVALALAASLVLWGLGVLLLAARQRADARAGFSAQPGAA